MCLGLFGGTQKKETSNPTGLFGGKSNAAAGGTNSLFGNKTGTTGTGTTGTGNLFGKTTGTGLGTTGNTSTGSGNTGTTSLFGKSNTSTGFLNSGTTGNKFGTGSSTLFGGGNTANNTSGFGFGQGTVMGNAMQTQQDQTMAHQAEIETCLTTYAKQIDPASPANNFVSCMYNKYNKSVNYMMKEQIKNFFPAKDISVIPGNTKVNGESVDLKQVEVHINQKKYTKAKRENPNQDDFYVKQINSHEELFE